MLFFVVLILALIRALMAFAIGFVFAMFLWFAGMITRTRIPAWLRWSAAAVVTGMHLYYFRIPVTRPDGGAEAVENPIGDFYFAVGAPYDGHEGWDAWQYDMNILCIGIALFALVVIGIFVSLTRTAVKVVAKSVAAAATEERDTPPSLPRG